MISNFIRKAVRVVAIRSTGTNKNGTQYVAGAYALRGAKGEPDTIQNFIASGKASKGFANAVPGSLVLVSGIAEPKSFTRKDGTPGTANDATLTFSAAIARKAKVAA